MVLMVIEVQVFPWRFDILAIIGQQLTALASLLLIALLSGVFFVFCASCYRFAIFNRSKEKGLLKYI